MVRKALVRALKEPSRKVFTLHSHRLCFYSVPPSDESHARPGARRERFFVFMNSEGDAKRKMTPEEDDDDETEPR